MVKILSLSMALLSVCTCIFMQPKDIASAELSVAEGNSVTEITQTVYVTKPTQKMTVVATAYCSCKSCCGVYAENRPNGVVYTASGAIAKANHTIAVDTSVIPFGTKVKYGDTIYVAEDTGSAIVGNKIDIYFDNHSSALEWGKRTIEIEVLK